MNSSRPYMIRAFYEWIVDNDLTPYLVVNAENEGVYVPQEYVESGRIILNIAPGAVKGLLIANDHLEFNARFSGVAQEIYAPMRSITAIYAKENGRGMVFKDDEYEDDVPPPPPSQKNTAEKSSTKKGAAGKNGKNGKPNLTIVK